MKIIIGSDHGGLLLNENNNWFRSWWIIIKR